VSPARPALQRLQALVQARAGGAADPRRVALHLAGADCGRLDGALAQRIAAAVPGFVLRGARLEASDPALDRGGRSALLERAARWLVQAAVVPAWRGELLDVRGADGATVLACIDRCAVRALGITTHSVRLNGYAAPDRLYVARRAAHKRVDPGLWDNLVGGLVAAGENLLAALARETEEEAGLQLDPARLQAGGALREWRTVSDGVLSEVVHVYDQDLPQGTTPVNRDGEVERFEIWGLERVCAAIEGGEFTVEASLAIVDSLWRRQHADGI